MTPSLTSPSLTSPSLASTSLASTGLTSSLSPALSPAATAALAGKTDAGSRAAKAKATGQDFEAMFLNSMFQQMFSGVGQGPFSGGHGANIWRSFLTDEYSKSFVKAGGIGIAAQVTRELLAQQEVR
jgi:Rod binding domain-containing protein